MNCPVLPAAVEEALYRIIAEAVTNVVRHADATRCVVRVVCNGEGLDADVIDDGHGIAAEALPGVGLRSMEARVTELGGTIHVGNCAAGGTIVRLHVPLEARTP